MISDHFLQEQITLCLEQTNPGKSHSFPTARAPKREVLQSCPFPTPRAKREHYPQPPSHSSSTAEGSHFPFRVVSTPHPFICHSSKICTCLDQGGLNTWDTCRWKSLPFHVRTVPVHPRRSPPTGGVSPREGSTEPQRCLCSVKVLGCDMSGTAHVQHGSCNIILRRPTQHWAQP